MKRGIRLVGAITATLVALSVSPAFAEPGYYPEGPQRNVAVSTLLNDGWVPCFSENYEEESSLVYEVIAACESDYIILTGRLIDGDTLELLAAAPRGDVFVITSDQEVHFSNGTYWYFVPERPDGTSAHSLGFSSTTNVNIHTCDYLNVGVTVEESQLKLCWHIVQDGDSAPLFSRGYRLGVENNPDVYSGNYLREIYMHSGNSNSLFRVDAVYDNQIAACGREFVRDVQALLSPSLNRYESCLFYDVTKTNIARVNADLAAAYKASVTAGKAMTEAEIIGAAQSLALRYNTIDRLISSPQSVYATDLVNIGLTGLNSVASKYQAINTLRYLANQDKDTYEELQAAIAAMKKK